MRRKIIAVILLLLLMIGAGSVWLFFFFQPSPEIIDETQDGGTFAEDRGNGEKENEGVLNKNVYVYAGEDADAVNDTIASVEFGEKDLVLKFADDTENGLTELGTGDIFWLDGDQSTPLLETYIGKVVSNIVQGEERLVSVESPMIDEVFDQLYLDEELQLSAENIDNISAVDGVTVRAVDTIPADFLETAETAEESTPEVQSMTADISRQKINDDDTLSLNAGDFIIDIDADLIELLELLSDEKEKEKDDKTYDARRTRRQLC